MGDGNLYLPSDGEGGYHVILGCLMAGWPYLLARELHGEPDSWFVKPTSPAWTNGRSCSPSRLMELLFCSKSRCLTNGIARSASASIKSSGRLLDELGATVPFLRDRYQARTTYQCDGDLVDVST